MYFCIFMKHEQVCPAFGPDFDPSPLILAYPIPIFGVPLVSID